MEKIIINFYKCIQDSQEFGSNNEHMVSRLFFEIGKNDYHCEVRQPYGSSYSFEEDPIEVSVPVELEKLVNYEQFREAAEAYFRSNVGKNGSGINMSNSINVRMMNNTFIKDFQITIDPAGMSGGW